MDPTQSALIEEGDEVDADDMATCPLDAKYCAGASTVVESPPTENVRHILYIQMQLCTQKTIGDLLGNMTTRKGNASSGIDVPHALKLFQQIAQAVTYVHAQGLIHRDLKPANCFVDEMGNVQVGDFGLSRESSGGVNKSASFQQSPSLGEGVDIMENLDHTAGVGTRSYASPEQMNGSDYQSSTDVSLQVRNTGTCFAEDLTLVILLHRFIRWEFSCSSWYIPCTLAWNAIFA